MSFTGRIVPLNPERRHGSLVRGLTYSISEGVFYEFERDGFGSFRGGYS